MGSCEIEIEVEVGGDDGQRRKIVNLEEKGRW